MSYLNTLTKIAKGAVVGVTAATALPIFGAVGTITATGVAIAATVGALAGLADGIGVGGDSK